MSMRMNFLHFYKLSNLYIIFYYCNHDLNNEDGESRQPLSLPYAHAQGTAFVHKEQLYVLTCTCLVFMATCLETN